MKHLAIIAVFVLGLLSASSCQKKCGEDAGMKYQSHAQIGERDYRKCSSCGGWFITIDGAQYRFFALPADNGGINLETDPRPINVSLNWHLDTEAASTEIIKIDAIRKD